MEINNVLIRKFLKYNKNHGKIVKVKIITYESEVITVCLNQRSEY